MSRGYTNPDELDPLQLALQLERAAPPRPDVPSEDPQGSESGGLLTPLDHYEAAKFGLTLVRRAVLRDRMLQEAADQGALNDTPRKLAGGDTAVSGLQIHAETTGIRQLDDDAVGIELSGASDQRCLGRFEILRELGRGGFGVVLLGRDPLLDRLVAIKIPRAESLFDEEARRRFDREARLGSLLSHPAIIPILEARSDGPVKYIAFAYCEGESLAAWFQKRSRKIEIELCARIVMHLAMAVQYAHQRGIVHRDLKPGNILLDLANDQQQTDSVIVASLRITDFGLAKSTSLAEVNLTREGAIVGTPAYMAPEQAAGQLESVTSAADIYSLGVILYEMLTGQPPFRKSSDLATLRAVEQDSVLAPRHLRPDLPADLEAICLKCLEKHPQQRYPTAHDLQQDLEHFLNHRPVQARRISSVEKLARWCRRNPPLAAAIATVLAGLVVAIWQWRQAEANWNLANVNWNRAELHLAQMVEQQERATRNLERSELAIDQMLNDVADVLVHVPRMESFRQRLLNQALQLQQDLISDQTDDLKVRFRTAQAWRRMAEIYSKLGDFTQALSALQSASAEMSLVQSAATGGSDVQLEQGQIELLQGQVLAKLERYADAKESAESAIRALSLVVSGRTDMAALEQLAKAHHLCGLANESEQQFPPAADAYQQVLVLVNQIPAENVTMELEIQRGRALNSLGVVYTKMKQADEAESFFRQSIAILEQVALNQPERISLGYNVAITSINLGNRYSRQKDHQQAVHYYDTANRIVAGLRSSFPENTAYQVMAVRAASGLGLSQWRSGDVAAGAGTLQGALNDHRTLPDQIRKTAESRDERAILLTNLGNLYHEKSSEFQDGDQQAQECYQESIALREELCIEFPDRIGYRRTWSVCLGNLANQQLSKGEFTSAKVTFAEALNIAEAAYALDDNDGNLRSNAEWQLQGLIEACLRSGAIDELLENIQKYIERGSGRGSRQLAAAKSLATCIEAIDQQVRPPSDSNVLPDSPQTEVDRGLLTSEADRERLMLLALELLGEAVNAGLLDASTITESAPWTTVMLDPRFRKLLRSND